MRLYAEHLEVWSRDASSSGFPGCAARESTTINYRHVIDWLVRKPGAFENYRYREDMFPTSRFRMAYDALRETTPSRASREYLRILELAARENESLVDDALGRCSRRISRSRRRRSREWIGRREAGPAGHGGPRGSDGSVEF